MALCRRRESRPGSLGAGRQECRAGVAGPVDPQDCVEKIEGDSLDDMKLHARVSFDDGLGPVLMARPAPREIEALHALGSMDSLDFPALRKDGSRLLLQEVCVGTLDRLVLSDGQWNRISGHIIGDGRTRGGSGRDNRMFVEAVLWIVRTGSPWRDLPDVFGSWNSMFRRFSRWSRKGAGGGSSRRCPTIPISESVRSSVYD